MDICTQRLLDDARRAFARGWAARHDAPHTFANGHVYDAAERRRGLRQNLKVQRGCHARAAS